MANFDELNRQTRDYNKYIHENYSRKVATSNNPISNYWLNYYNNQTYKQNNGTYSPKYY